jgi:hypothetical protein
MTPSAGPKRPALEVADVIRRYGGAFLARHRLTVTQRKALRDLSLCRTAALGGHVQRCLDCGHERLAYNSCRNRHCPKCQALTRARWLEREANLLLPVAYYHVVFTLPQEVAALALANPTVLYHALFQAAAATLRDAAANPKRLGAQLGILMVLHTWGQNLHHHPHVHCVCTGGGLSCDERGVVDQEPCWRSCRPGFFLPVRVLSRLFRGKFLARLRADFEQGKLKLGGTLAGLTDAKEFARWLTPLYRKEWVVYAKRPFGGPAQVLKYLARYTHRVAISNRRLVAMTPSPLGAEGRGEGTVTFRYKDYAAEQRNKKMTLAAEEFLRRFVQHVLPKGFVKIRHYGLLANRSSADRLRRCRRLLLPLAVKEATAAAEPPAVSDLLGLGAARQPHCPRCGGSRLLRIELPKEPAALATAATDTS